VLRVEARHPLGALEIDVELTVERGECLALAGPSGAGKTSVLRVAAGLLRPEHGRVEANGETWLDTERGIDLPPEQRRAGYVFQHYALFPHLSAWQNVAYPVRGLKPERRARAIGLLERFGLADRADARPPRSAAASVSASPSRGRSRASPTSCSSTSRCRRSTPAPGPRRHASSAASCARARPRRCW